MLDYVARTSPILSADAAASGDSSLNPLQTSPISHEVEHPNFIKKYAAKKVSLPLAARLEDRSSSSADLRSAIYSSSRRRVASANGPRRSTLPPSGTTPSPARSTVGSSALSSKASLASTRLFPARSKALAHHDTPPHFLLRIYNPHFF